MDLINLLKNDLHILILAAAPLIELRGAIPAGIALGMTPMNAAIVSYIGSSLPAPFLLLFLQPVFDRLRHIQFFDRLIHKLQMRTHRKVKNLHTLSLIGLMLFVAVPLPTTGVWTACLAATMVQLRFKESLVSILVGNAIAAFLVTSGSALILEMIQTTF